MKSATLFSRLAQRFAGLAIAVTARAPIGARMRWDDLAYLDKKKPA